VLVAGLGVEDSLVVKLGVGEAVEAGEADVACEFGRRRGIFWVVTSVTILPGLSEYAVVFLLVAGTVTGDP